MYLKDIQMEINNLPFPQQVKENDSTSKVFTASLLIDLKKLFDRAIENNRPSPKNNYSSTHACRDLRIFFNTFLPH